MSIARYDDIYYTITPQKVDEQPEPDANTPESDDLQYLGSTGYRFAHR